MAEFAVTCLLCGLSYWQDDGSLDVGDTTTQYFKCIDSVSCAERWLTKYLDGRGLDIQEIALVGDDPLAPPTFRVAYQSPGQPIRRRLLTLPVCLDDDTHRTREHYHILEGDREVTSTFTA